MKHMVIVNHKRFMRFLVSSIFLLSLFTVLLFGFLSDTQAFGMSENPVRTITVQRGESVWSIAKPLAEKTNQDTRDIVREIYRLNHLDKATLHPGQSLLIPNI
ncbi:LysM peptidoglycan-binding domain-containing protein [Peptoniphilaceae bacterium SGI.137]|nr:LysM peptidoglycan-binding domain-containing protein [Peptoniphilaceae bacterium]MCI6659319.1 LysM peptidoglycan-binding domain-containing protein [Peptoniphilaceae bacterium]MDY3987085.1 LysM peptidoglycan-binding domain-containing protein [Peptoniphilaceae bacterium]MDY4197065.1 LysM peptidoglycan-binding domain-containing protein [Peptoniphilaceae bacterium]MDY6146324.1 LysM peptidoglycan-binding domain-containing protein [Peptoniphilaceae bacterium]